MKVTSDIEEARSYRQWEYTLAERIDNLSDLSPDSCIYRVPAKLRNVNESNYTPQIVSAGPFHHGKSSLCEMEEYKLRCLKEFLKRTGLALVDLITMVKNWEMVARGCYAEAINESSDYFVQMILVDSCFMIETICKATTKDNEGKFDYLSMPKIIFDVRTDLILLENQVPFFVLNGIYNLAFAESTREMSFTELSIRYLSDLMLVKDVEKIINSVVHQVTSTSQVKHFVDLVRICHLQSSAELPVQANRVDSIVIPRAVELQGAGITFKKGSSNCLMDIKYSTGLLEIPEIKVDNYSKYVLVNLVAFEHCHYPFNTYITDYLLFMDQLIDTRRDVELLARDKIIEDRLSESDEVSYLFNSLAKEINWGSEYYFNDISQHLNAYCDVPFNSWKGRIKRDYFNKRWNSATTIFALVFLTLTVIQTIRAVISM
ncbi:hypothetical protein LguiA_002719 [Lonicera macranthoides]